MERCQYAGGLGGCGGTWDTDAAAYERGAGRVEVGEIAAERGQPWLARCWTTLRTRLLLAAAGGWMLSHGAQLSPRMTILLCSPPDWRIDPLQLRSPVPTR